MLSKNTSYDYGGVVASVIALHLDANKQWPSHFKEETSERTGAEFDVGNYFSVLKHVTPPEGHVLDYVYWYAGGNGSPHLYLRKTSEPRFRTYEELEKVAGQEIGEIALLDFEEDSDKTDAREEAEDLPSRLQVDGTPEGFFELVVFKALAGQFYLAWHANYNDTKIVTSRNEVEAIIADIDLSSDRKEQVRCLDVTPSIKYLDQDTASVSVVLFSNWRGFFRVTEKISRVYPHRFLDTEIQDLVYYNCGLVF